MSSTDPHLETFERVRARLFGVAYRMTGSVGDAEDIVQDVYLAWARQELGAVERPAAYLTRAVVHRARDLLDSARHRRERYVGPWLPEPLVRTHEDAPDHSAEAALAGVESLRMAMLLLLDRLGPDERAVFVLKEVFGYRYGEIAELVGKSEAACRKLGERARAKVHAQPAALDPGSDADPAHTQQVMAAFFLASERGDVAGLTAMLRADAVLYSDGGGKVQAALKPVVGAGKIAKFLIGVRQLREGETLVPLPAIVNEAPGFVLLADGVVDSCGTLDVDPDGRVRAIYLVRNPDKLRHVAGWAAVARS